MYYLRQCMNVSHDSVERVFVGWKPRSEIGSKKSLDSLNIISILWKYMAFHYVVLNALY